MAELSPKMEDLLRGVRDAIDQLEEGIEEDASEEAMDEMVSGLISRQRAEIEKLQDEVRKQAITIRTQAAEIHRLQKGNGRLV